MLVLSRRNGERILIPEIATSIQVQLSRPGTVRLAIDAPPQVTILREEIAAGCELPPRGGRLHLADAPDAAGHEAARRRDHALRNRLNAAAVGLALARRQRDHGLLDDLDRTLARVAAEVEALRQQVDPPVPPAPAPAESRPSHAPRALLVEDDPNECELLAGLLRLAGMQVVTAGDGADALTILRRQDQPDFVLLDMALPHCDGPTTLRAIRSDPACRDLPVFAVSGSPQDRFDEATGRAVNRWFRKPINPEVLLRELRTVGQGAPHRESCPS